MDKQNLLLLAKDLMQPGKSAAEEYNQKAEALAEKVSHILKNRSDLDKLIGMNNTEMMIDNHRNHARFMSSIFQDYNPEVFLDTVLWVFRAYRSHGFKITYWPAMLDTWIQLMKTDLNEESFKQIYPFYHWLLINQASFVMLSDEILKEKGNSMH